MNDYENFYNFSNNNLIFNELIRLSLKNLDHTTKSRNKNQYINESLLAFNKISKNDMLDELITNIIEFKKMCCNPGQNKSFSLSCISSNYLLYHQLEKNLIEISYLSNAETRNKKIKILYNWYRKLLGRNNSLKKITSKSYIEPYEIYDIKNNKNENEIIANKSNNTNINYSTNNINNNKINDNEENSNTISNVIQSSSMITQKSDIITTNDNSNWDFMTYFYSNKNHTNSSTIPKNSSAIFSDYTNKEENKKNIILPSLKPEMKFSYSYNRPCCDHKSIEIENKIINHKLKLVAEKRSLENINHKINHFGIMRAKLKENINNKCEIKNLIKMYVNNQSSRGGGKSIISPLLKKYVIKDTKNLSKSVDFEGEKKNDNKEKGLDKLSNTNSDHIKEYHVNNGFNTIAIDSSNEHKKGIIMKNHSSKKNFFERKVTLSVSKKELRDMYGFNKENLKKAFRHSNSIKNKSNVKKNEHEDHKKNLRLFFGINHTKIFVNNIKNIDNNNNLIIDNKDNERKIDIKMKSKINKKFAEDNEDKSYFVMDINSQMFSSHLLYNQKYQYFDSLNKSTKNENNIKKQNDDNKEYESELKVDDPYKNKYKIANNYKLSAFHLENLKKIQSYRNRNLNNAYKRFQSFDLNMKIKNEMNNNYNLHKNNYLFMRKKMKPLKKIEFEQLKTKIKKINFRHNDRYDNIDEDNLEDYNEDYSEDNDYNLGYYKNLIKNNGKFFRQNSSEILMNRKKENSLLNALISPNDNLIYSLYYYPRPESKLLIRK